MAPAPLPKAPCLTPTREEWLDFPNLSTVALRAGEHAGEISSHCTGRCCPSPPPPTRRTA